jgi:flagellar biogenesis protein FliO
MYKIFCLLVLCFLPWQGEAEPDSIPLPPELQERYLRAEQEGDSKFYSSFVQMLIYLALLIAVLYAGMYLVKRMLYRQIGHVNASDLIHIVERKILTPRSTLYIVEVKGRSYLLSDSVYGARLIKELPFKSFEEVLDK